MNNTDILELKKRYKKDNSITRIQGCYVLGMEKKIQTTIDSWFSDLDESEQFKYLELVKKGFSFRHWSLARSREKRIHRK